MWLPLLALVLSKWGFLSRPMAGGGHACYGRLHTRKLGKCPLFRQELVAHCQDGASPGASHPWHGSHLFPSPWPFLVLCTRGQEVTTHSPWPHLGLFGTDLKERQSVSPCSFTSCLFDPARKIQNHSWLKLQGWPRSPASSPSTAVTIAIGPGN